MAQNINPKGNYFLIGVGIGSLMGVLFAPKSGAETRKYLAKRADEGNELARKKVREMMDRTEDIVARGKKVIVQTESRIASAIEVGVKTYSREVARARVS